jgi:aldehyde:ferredoxin oxidoreductase
MYLKADEFVPSEKVAKKTVAMSCYKELVDGSGGCLFAMVMGVNHWKLFEWLNAATGWQKTPDEYMVIGKRIQTMRQLFGIKHGIDPISYKMSPRMAGEPPLSAGPNKGKTIPIKEMMQEHWKAYGWDGETGIPTNNTLAELGLQTLAVESK